MSPAVQASPAEAPARQLAEELAAELDRLQEREQEHRDRLLELDEQVEEAERAVAHARAMGDDKAVGVIRDRLDDYRRDRRELEMAQPVLEQLITDRQQRLAQARHQALSEAYAAACRRLDEEAGRVRGLLADMRPLLDLDQLVAAERAVQRAWREGTAKAPDGRSRRTYRPRPYGLAQTVLAGLEEVVRGLEAWEQYGSKRDRSYADAAGDELEDEEEWLDGDLEEE